VWQYPREGLLAAAADILRQIMARMAALAYAILDGTPIAVDRVADQTPYYSGRHTRHGVNVQVLADPAGRLVWASPTLPGATHDLTAARNHDLIEALSTANVMTFAGKGYHDAGGSVFTPFTRHKQRPPLSRRQKQVNRAHARIRALGERATATLKTWKILTKLRCCPCRATAIVQATLVPQTVDDTRYPG
jgi:hypothetical protein